MVEMASQSIATTVDDRHALTDLTLVKRIV
jgi:hypothetical protein